MKAPAVVRLSLALTLLSPLTLQAKTLHLSLVKKNSVNEFYSRMATEKHQIVVTDDPVSHALASEQLTLAKVTDFAVFELEPNQTAPAGSICLQNICLTSKTVNQHHDHFHLQALDEEKITAAPENVGLKHSPNFFLPNLPQNISISAIELKEKLSQFSG